MLIAQCKGIQLGKFRIPPFELNSGELIGIFLHGGSHDFDLQTEIVELFTGQKKSPNQLQLYHKLAFVERNLESRLRNMYFSTTVRQYLLKKGKSGSEELSRIYEIEDINPQTRINSLAGNPRKWLSLFVTLSNSHNIIFDTAGQDPLGAEHTLKIVGEYVEKGGAAILLDNFDDSEVRCTKFIRIQVAGS